MNDTQKILDIAEKLKISPEKQTVLRYIENANADELDQLLTAIRNKQALIGKTVLYVVNEDLLDFAWFKLDELPLIQAFMPLYLAKEKPMSISYRKQSYPTPEAVANLADTEVYLKENYPELVQKSE